jgi:hypothetical protein
VALARLPQRSLHYRVDHNLPRRCTAASLAADGLSLSSLKRVLHIAACPCRVSGPFRRRAASALSPCVVRTAAGVPCWMYEAPAGDGTRLNPVRVESRGFQRSG